MRIRLFSRVRYLSKTFCVIFVIVILAGITLAGRALMKKEEIPELIRSDTGENPSVLPAVSPSLTPFLLPTDVPTPVPTEAPQLAIHITGEIVCPGVYRTYDGAILQDLVDMAGGLTDKADTYVINLAIRVRDGMRIHIPSVDDESKIWLIEGGRVSDGKASDDKVNSLVNINTAGIDELMTLSGIGESMANDIINYRSEHGFFLSIEEIMNVPGIKEAKFSRIKNQITV